MARDYKARFYTDSSNLKGYLKTEQKVTPEYAKQAKNDWKAQGTAADVKYAFDQQGHGAIVNSSRGIMCAWKKTGGDGHDFAQAARSAAIAMRDDIAQFVTVE